MTDHLPADSSLSIDDLMAHLRDEHERFISIGVAESYEGAALALIESKAARIAELEQALLDSRANPPAWAERDRLAYLQLQLERDALVERLAELTAPSAPTAWIEVSNGEIVGSGFYAPGLPDGTHDLYPVENCTALPPGGSREGYYTLSQISYALNRSLSAKTSSGMVDAIVEDLIELLPRVAVTTAAAPPGNSPPWRRAPSFQDALQRKAIDIADEHFGYPARGPAVDGSCMCGYCQYARVRGAMLAAPTKPACRCGHSFAPNHQTPGTECAVEDCPCGSYRPSPETTAPLPVCIYEYEPDDTLYFETGCGKQFVLDAMLELYEFCPYCGKPIEERVSESEPAETNGDRNG